MKTETFPEAHNEEGEPHPLGHVQYPLHCAVRGSGPARGNQEERSSVAMTQKPRQKNQR